MNMSVIDAAFNVAHDYPGGADALAHRMGKRPGVLGNELRCAGSAKLGAEDAEKMTLLSKDLRILQAFATNCGQMLVPLPIGLEHPDECLARLSNTAKEFGDVVTEASAALADGKISDNERQRIEREVGEMIVALHGLLASVAQRNEAGKPAHIRVAA